MVRVFADPSAKAAELAGLMGPAPPDVDLQLAALFEQIPT
jgi:hypothetical protein